jgi:hypothetical protein
MEKTKEGNLMIGNLAQSNGERLVVFIGGALLPVAVVIRVFVVVGDGKLEALV